jgi:uncharacterized protein YecT (DUF1311 family)
MHRGRSPFLPLPLIATSIVLSSVFAENQSTELMQADAKLNRLYQQVMSSLSAIDREHLRAAERAWIGFRDKNQVALRATSEKSTLSTWQKNALDNLYMIDTDERCDQLRGLSGNGASNATMKDVESEDAELNKVYKQALAGLSQTADARLREAQRAWLDFYNLSLSAGPNIDLLIIQDRIGELSGIYLERAALNAPDRNAFPNSLLPDGSPGGRPTADFAGDRKKAETGKKDGEGVSQTPGGDFSESSETEEKIDPTIPDPFERGRVDQPPP